MSESMLTEQPTNSTPQASPAQPVAAQAPTQANQAQEQKSVDQPAQAVQQKSEDAAKPQGQAEFVIKSPEGVEYDKQVLSKYTEVAKELNLTQEAAQKMLDKIAPALHERQTQQIADVHQQWISTAKADKEFGGDKLQENLGVARKALDSFGTQELRALLEESGLGNHPEIIRFMYRAGSAISGDRYVGGSPTAGKAASGPKSFNDFAATLYPNQQ